MVLFARLHSAQHRQSKEDVKVSIQPYLIPPSWKQAHP